MNLVSIKNKQTKKQKMSSQAFMNNIHKKHFPHSLSLESHLRSQLVHVGVLQLYCNNT